MRATLRRAAAWITLLPAVLAAQRMAPLPPPCALPGSNVVARSQAPAVASAAVLPLAVSGAASRVGYLSDGLANAIAQRVGSTMPKIGIAARKPSRRATSEDAGGIRALGLDLAARYLITGAVSSVREGIRVSIRLFDGASGKRIWEKSFAFDSADAFPIVRSASLEVASRLAGPLSPADSERVGRVATRSRVAYDWSLRGDAATTGGAYERAVDAYRQAVNLDPGFVDAYAKLALADAALLEEGVEKSSSGASLLTELRSAADKAVTGDPKSALAWLAEGRSRLLAGRPIREWREAFDRALKLDAREPAIFEHYGLALAQTEDRSAAREMLRRAATLAPTRADIATALAELAVADNNDGEACGLLNRAIASDAVYGPAWATRALLRSRHDDLRFAWADAETATQLGMVLLGESAAAIIDLKARDTTRALTRLGEVWLDVSSRGTISAREGRAVASAFIAAGQVPRALDVLEAVRPRSALYASVLRDPIFDRARNDPRFRALMVPPRAGSPEANIGVTSTPAGVR